MAAISILNAIAPEFATLDSGVSLLFIDMASDEIDIKIWGAKADRATALLAAHMLTLRQRGGSGQAGATIMEKVGDLQQQFAAPNLRESEQTYSTTTYGIEFVRLRRTIIRGPLVV